MDYEQVAQLAAEESDVVGNVRRFAEQYGLSKKRVLDVGSGRGYLQDIVPDYTGLDISETVASRYHKPFVVGSATAMPFPDHSFDAIWSIWVLEHIPQPEAALRDMRRVLKPGGVIFLAPAWNSTPWAADGFDVRPYGDFNWRGKIIKASMLYQREIVGLTRMPIRGMRWAAYSLTGGNTRLHFRHLQANYSIYWEPDSDAVTSLDRYETCLWFKSRGDECLSGDDARTLDSLTVRVRK